MLTVFTADHGAACSGKGTPYDGGARVPLLLRWPRHAVAAANVWMRHIDWLPTLAELAGVDPTGLGTDGVSRAHALWPTAVAQPALGSDDKLELFLENGKSRGVRERDWKLMVAPAAEGSECAAAAAYVSCAQQYPTKDLHPAYCSAVQLYNLQNDPREQYNLANDTSHATDLRRLASKVEAHDAKTVQKDALDAEERHRMLRSIIEKLPAV